MEEKSKGEWSEILPFIALAMNTSRHKTLNFSPFFIMYGRKAQIPADLIHPNKLQAEEEAESFFPTKTVKYASELIERMAKIFEMVRER